MLRQREYRARLKQHAKMREAAGNREDNVDDTVNVTKTYRAMQKKEAAVAHGKVLQ